jgi:hypothetical protein
METIWKELHFKWIWLHFSFGARRGESVRCSADRISGWLGRNETAINNNERSFPPIQKIGFGHSVSIVYVTIGLDQRITTDYLYNSVGAWIIELSLTWLFIEFVVGRDVAKEKGQRQKAFHLLKWRQCGLRTVSMMSDFHSRTRWQREKDDSGIHLPVRFRFMEVLHYIYIHRRSGKLSRSVGLHIVKIKRERLIIDVQCSAQVHPCSTNCWRPAKVKRAAFFFCFG